MTRTRVAALLLTLAVVALLVPPGRSWAKGAALAADALDLPLPRPLAGEVVRERTELGGVTGDRYAVAADGPAVLLVPGATPLGLDDPRVVDLATALTRSRRTVFVPQLELYEEELVTRDVRRLVDATAALADEHGSPVVVAGISYGGSLALLAAADPRVRGAVAEVALFGSYVDLLGLVQAITTGISLVDDRRIPWDPHPDAEEVLRERILELLPSEQREFLSRSLTGDLDPAELPEPAATFHRLLSNTDPERTHAIAAELPTDVRSRLGRLSPVTVLDDVEARITVLHARDDPLVPYGEAVRLATHRPDATLLPLTTFAHVERDPTSPRDVAASVGDLARVWRFAARVLDPHEGVLPSRP